MGINRELLKTVLGGYQKLRINWDEYAQKLDLSTREALADIFQECRRSGFFAPWVHGDTVYFRQLAEGDFPERGGFTLCSLCENDCTKKDQRGMFIENNNKEIKKCWEG